MLFGVPDENELPVDERPFNDKPTHPSEMGHDIIDERLNRQRNRAYRLIINNMEFFFGKK